MTPDQYIQWLADEVSRLESGGEQKAPRQTKIGRLKGRRKGGRPKAGRSKYVRSLREWERKRPKLKMRRAVITQLDRGRIY